MQDEDKKYRGEDWLAEVLGMSLGTIRNRYSKGLDMPPYIPMPKGRLYKAEAVYGWLDARMVTVEPPKRRGRPPNSVLAARAAGVAHGETERVRRQTRRQRHMADPATGEVERLTASFLAP